MPPDPLVGRELREQDLRGLPLLVYEAGAKGLHRVDDRPATVVAPLVRLLQHLGGDERRAASHDAGQRAHRGLVGGKLALDVQGGGCRLLDQVEDSVVEGAERTGCRSAQGNGNDLIFHDNLIYTVHKISLNILLLRGSSMFKGKNIDNGRVSRGFGGPPLPSLGF